MKKYLQIDGRKVAVEVEGRGKPLLMLHGWGGSIDSWRALKDELKKIGVLDSRMAITVDFPGFGESEDPLQAWQVNDYAVFVEKLLAELYRQYNLAGDYDVIVHSFGGRVVIKLLSVDFPHQIVEKIDKVVLVAAAGIKRPPTLRMKVASTLARMGKGLQKLTLLRSLAPLAKKFLYRALKTHDYEQSSGIMRATFLKVIDEDLKDGLDHIKAPTLIFWGRKDSYVPLADGEYMNRKILGSKLIVFPDGKHGIHKTKAALMAEEISKFFNPLT